MPSSSTSGTTACLKTGLGVRGTSLVRDVDVDPLAALDAAFARQLSGYDAEFVALAESLGVTLVTDDRRVLTACPGLAVSLDGFGEAAEDTSGR